MKQVAVVSGTMLHVTYDTLHQELATVGLTFTKQDFIRLQRQILTSTKKYDLMELDARVMERFLKQFVDLPYLRPQTYVATLCQLIDLYYVLHTGMISFYDEDILWALEEACRKRHGICDEETAKLARIYLQEKAQ